MNVTIMILGSSDSRIEYNWCLARMLTTERAGIFRLLIKTRTCCLTSRGCLT